MDEERFTIGDLAELTGVTRRTIRFYVQKGLLPPPEGAGRGHYYTAAHRERVCRIREYQEDGSSLEAIRGILEARLGSGEGAAPRDRPGPPKLWVRARVAPGVELHVEAGRYTLGPSRIAKIVELLAPFFREAPEPMISKEEDYDGCKE